MCTVEAILQVDDLLDQVLERFEVIFFERHVQLTMPFEVSEEDVSFVIQTVPIYNCSVLEHFLERFELVEAQLMEKTVVIVA